jgi:hypothetical protein
MAARAWSALLSSAGGIVFPLARIAQPGALAADPAAPQLKVSRYRSSFICGHLAAGTPLGELPAITGICQAEPLGRYARHVGGGPAKAVLRAWDKRQQGR